MKRYREDGNYTNDQSDQQEHDQTYNQSNNHLNHQLVHQLNHQLNHQNNQQPNQSNNQSNNHHATNLSFLQQQSANQQANQSNHQANNQTLSQQYAAELLHASTRLSQYNPFMSNLMTNQPVNQSPFPPMVAPYQSAQTFHHSNPQPFHQPVNQSINQSTPLPVRQPVKAQVITHPLPVIQSANATTVATVSNNQPNDVTASFSSTKIYESAPFWELRTDHKQFLYVTHPGHLTVQSTPLCTLQLIQSANPANSQSNSNNSNIPPLVLRSASSRAPWSSINQSNQDRTSPSIVTRFEIDSGSKDVWKAAMKGNRMTGQNVQGYVTIRYEMKDQTNLQPNATLRQYRTTIQVGWRTGKEEKRRSRSVKRMNNQALTQTLNSSNNQTIEQSISQTNNQSSNEVTQSVEPLSIFRNALATINATQQPNNQLIDQSNNQSANLVDLSDLTNQHVPINTINQSNNPLNNGSGIVIKSESSIIPIHQSNNQSINQLTGQTNNQSTNLTPTPSPLLQGLQRQQSYGSINQSINQSFNPAFASPMFQSTPSINPSLPTNHQPFGLPLASPTNGAFWPIDPSINQTNNQSINQTNSPWHQPSYDYFRQQMSPQQQPLPNNQLNPVLVPMAMRNYQSNNQTINQSINSPQQSIMSPMFNYWQSQSPQHLPLQMLTPRAISTPQTSSVPAPNNTNHTKQ